MAAIKMNRRAAIGTAVGLTLGLTALGAVVFNDEPSGEESFTTKQRLAAYLTVQPDGTIKITMPMSEMGQGVYSSLPKILADELGADWDRVEVVQSPGDPVFASLEKGTQATGRSMSVTGYFDLMRELGATARTMLTAAAAASWGVPASEIAVSRSQLTHKNTGKSASFGEFAQAAADLPVPTNPQLKDPSEFTLIGKSMASKDAGLKARGKAQYGMDFGIAEMPTAVVRMAPWLGATVASGDFAAARAMPGVRDVVTFGGKMIDLPYPAGVAVVADSFWQAQTALAQIAVEWSGGNAEFSSANEAEARLARINESGLEGDVRGDVEAALGSATASIDAVYECPYLAHGTMEPMSAAAHVTADGCTLWSPTQGPEVTKTAVAQLLGIGEDRIVLNRMFLGGGFGRRYQRDFSLQAAEISRAIGGPVKLVWTREEDTQHDFYRPAQTMRLRLAAGPDGALEALSVKAVGPSILAWGRDNSRLKGSVDPTSFSGISDTRYPSNNFRIEWLDHETPVPIGVWRSVGHSHNGFFLEGAIDELAHAAGADPYKFRQNLLADDPWMLGVLDKAAEQIGWGKAMPDGHGLGIAVMESYGSAVAHAAHVSVIGGTLKIERVETAIDCGFAIDPQNVVAQMQGGTLFGLSALFEEITLEKGAVQQSNFSDYPIISFADLPEVNVSIVESGHELGGVGECGVPTAIPSVVNAIHAATGKRFRKLPLPRTIA